MNPIKKRIQKRIDAIPKHLVALRDVCARNLSKCSAIELDDTCCIAHRPWGGPENYACVLFPAAKKTWFRKYDKVHGIKIPRTIRDVLSCVNGWFVFEFSFFGMAPSMLHHNAIDRSTRQCLDLALANSHQGWKWEFTDDPEEFHFGARQWSDTKNVGYFLRPNKQIRAILKGGKVVKQWSDFGQFLIDEIAEAERNARAQIPEKWWH